MPDVIEQNGKSLLRERAYHELKELILSGQLSRMPFLSERKLARKLGMSNTPVRSAVERLELEGLISIGPQRGILVRDLTTGEIADQFEIREALELCVVRKLAGNLSPSQVRELRSNVSAYAESCRAGDVHRFITLDGEFHLLLAEFSGNAEIERVLRQLRERIFRVIGRVIEHVPERKRQSVQEHRGILDCLIAADAHGTAELMTQHLRDGLKSLLPGGRGVERLGDRASADVGSPASVSPDHLER